MAYSFRDLRAYQQARDGAKEIFQVSKRFPREETYALTDQMRRSSRAVGALIAEAWGRRRYPNAFAEKLSQALAEAQETQAWLDHALDCGYLEAAEFTELDVRWQAVGGRIVRMIQQKNQFRQSNSP